MDFRDRIIKLAARVEANLDKHIGRCDVYEKDIFINGGHITPCMGDASNGWTHCNAFQKINSKYLGTTGDFDRDVVLQPECKLNAFHSKE